MFTPGCSEAPAAIDQGVRSDLADSLQHVYDAGLKPAGCTDLQVAAALADIRAHRVRPGLFGRYYDLVFATTERRYEDAARRLQEIVLLSREHPELMVLPFTEASLGSETELFGRLLDLAGETPALIAGPDEAAYHGFQEGVLAAFELIDRADPALGAELRALIVQVVAAVPSSHGGRTFDGASSFMLWGAIFLNLERHRTTLDLVESLVHEGAHQLLFGLSRREKLVENDVGERFGSPLRRDLRPMIGVFHATFVCARIHYALSRIKERASVGLGPADNADIDRRLEAHRLRFAQGRDEVHRHARLTVLGGEILEATEAYMREAA